MKGKNKMTALLGKCGFYDSIPECCVGVYWSTCTFYDTLKWLSI